MTMAVKQEFEFPKLKTFRARLVRVIDGDTAEVELDLGFGITATQRLRLLGINACELHSKVPEEVVLALAAKKRLGELLANNGNLWNLSITTSKTEKYGRWLALIVTKDITMAEVGQQLLAEGLAKIDV